MSQLKIHVSTEQFEQRKWWIDILSTKFQVKRKYVRNYWDSHSMPLLFTAKQNYSKSYILTFICLKLIRKENLWVLGFFFNLTRSIENKHRWISFYGLCSSSTCCQWCVTRAFSLFNILFIKQWNEFSTGKSFDWSFTNQDKMGMD